MTDENEPTKRSPPTKRSLGDILHEIRDLLGPAHVLDRLKLIGLVDEAIFALDELRSGSRAPPAIEHRLSMLETDTQLHERLERLEQAHDALARAEQAKSEFLERVNARIASIAESITALHGIDEKNRAGVAEILSEHGMALKELKSAEGTNRVDKGSMMNLLDRVRLLEKRDTYYDEVVHALVERMNAIVRGELVTDINPIELE